MRRTAVKGPCSAPSVLGMPTSTPPAAGLAAAVAGVVAAIDRLAETAPAGEDDEVLADAVAQLDRCGRRVEGQSLRLLAEASERDLPSRSAEAQGGDAQPHAHGRGPRYAVRALVLIERR